MPIERRVAGYFAEFRWRAASRLFATAGLRVDDIVRGAIEGDPLGFSPRPALPEDRVVAANPRAAISYYLRTSDASGGNWSRLHGGAGTGIRPPDAFEIAFTDNPGLKPERSKSVDAGFEQALAGGLVIVDATWFLNRYDDLIVAVGRSLQDYSRYRTDNIANARAQGLETSFALRTRRGLEARASYTFLDTEVLAVDNAPGVAPAPFTRRRSAPPPAAAPGARRSALPPPPRHGVRPRRRAVRGARRRAELGRVRRPVFGAGIRRRRRGCRGPRRPARRRARPGRQPLRPLRTKPSSATPRRAGRSPWESALLRADNVTYVHEGGRAGERAGRAPMLPGSDRLALPGVQEVSVRVERGHVVGILGPNGSGKTTLLRLLAGMLRPESGTVTLNGTDVASLSRAALARSIAVVPQETHLAFDYSVLEIALMGRYPHLGTFELEGPRDLAIAREALAATGTAALERRSFATLSGGEKQRVVIASALAQQADILLLDEPTASLDIGYQFDIAALLARLNRERGTDDRGRHARPELRREPLQRHRDALRRPRHRRGTHRRHAHQHVHPGALRRGGRRVPAPRGGPPHGGAAPPGAA